MKKIKLTSLALIMVLLLLTPMSIANATNSGVTIPIAGTFTDQAGGVGRFSGTFNITRFAVVNDSIHAVGVISGTLTDSQGNVTSTGLQTASLPITAATGPAATAGASQQSERAVKFTKASFDVSEKAPLLAAARSAPVPQASCQILRLSIGAIDLNLLGLTVHLNPVLLVITAVPGPGNLLGNLLCAIANLLNGGGPLAQIVALLNQILALLGG